MVQNVAGQKISCSWERHQNKKLIGKQIGTSSKREHAKSKCKAQQDKCTGIVEFGPNNFSVSFRKILIGKKISETSTFLGGTTLDCEHWFWVVTHYSVTFGSG